jgi:thiamine-monophosphate kinase
LRPPRPFAGNELAITTDMLVEGTHFLPDTDPGQLGWKVLAVSLSDLAAMAARPRWALLAGSLPAAREGWIAAFAEGLFACASRYGVDLIGGDTTRGPLNLCLTAIGELPTGTALRRDRALPGDDLWVSGQPGLAALGLAHLQGRTRLPEPLAEGCLAALQRPLPRDRTRAAPARPRACRNRRLGWPAR